METQEAIKVKTQKDAVYTYVMESITKKIDPANQIIEYVDKGVKKAVRLKLFQAIKTGEVRLNSEYDDSKLKKYCSGLINNWLKKDPRYH